MNRLKALENPLLTKSLRVLLLRGLGVLFLFGVTLLITNRFPESLVGAYDVSRAFLFVFGTFCLLGMNQSVIYYSGVFAAKDSLGSIKSLYRKMLGILVVTSALGFGIVALLPADWIDAFYNKPVYGLLLKTSLVVLFYGLTMLNIEIYRALRKFEMSEVIRNVLRYLFFLIGLVFIDQMGHHESLVDLFLVNFVLIGLLTSMMVYVTLSRTEKPVEVFHVSLPAIIRRSFPMSISFMCFLLMQSVDIILIGKFMDFKQVAFYSVAVKLTTIVVLVLSSVNAVFAPKIAELFAGQKMKELRKEIRRVTRMIFVITMPIVLLISLFSDQLLSFFGPGYTASSSALRILLVAQVLNAACGSVGVFMNMTGDQKTFRNIVLIALLGNLLLNWIFIPQYGLVGAASATAVSMIFWNIIAVIHIYKKHRIKTFIH